MSIESKTPFPVYPDVGFLIVNTSLAPSLEELIPKQIADEKIKKLMEENKHLREEIKALKGIIKNMNG
jgi:chaperonin cofactor prefoldin